MAQLRMAPATAVDVPGHRLLRRAGMALAAIVVLLAIGGQLVVVVNSVRSGAWLATGSSIQVPATGSLRHRLTVVLEGALGPSNRGTSRFSIVALRNDATSPHRVDVSMRWAINNDLSAGTLGNAAQGDAYILLRDLYTSGLPISTVKLDATYPLSGSPGRHRESVVMHLAMSARIAATIRAIGWDNFDAQTLWPLIQRTYVNPQFQPLAPE